VRLHGVDVLAVSYAYLWRHEHNRGLEQGLKVRQCAIVLATEAQNSKVRVTVVPITHRAPADPMRAIAPVRRHLGLDDAASWIIADEVNQFTGPGPDLRPVSRRVSDRSAYGFLLEEVFDALCVRIVALHRAGEVKATPRSE
jgi:hypothetical protein